MIILHHIPSLAGGARDGSRHLHLTQVQVSNTKKTFVPLRVLCGKSVLELFQEPEVVAPEISNVVDLIAQHELAFGSHAPGKT